MIANDILTSEPKRDRRKRVGRGIGSGRGKTCTRGTKGQYSRTGADSKLGHEGGQMPLFRRLPRRGFNNARFRGDAISIVNVGQLEQWFEAGTKVDLSTLVQRGLIKKNAKRIKILGAGELSKGLTVEAHFASDSARKKIEAASGSFQQIQ